MEKRPHVIFILSDQHNPRVIGRAGDPWVRTPNLDRLMDGGVALDNCYCASPLCVPSRISLLTGLLPRHTGVYNNMQAMRSDQATFPAAMTVGGYETVLAGRMHFVGPDQRHGYEFRLVGDVAPTQIGMANDTHGMLTGATGQARISVDRSGAGNSAVLEYDAAVVDAACEYLRRDRERPLFMTVGLYGPHCPYVAPPDLYRHYYDLLPLPKGVSAAERENRHPFIRNWCEQRGIAEVDPEDVRRVRAAYYGMVEYVDGLIGKVMDAAAECLDPDNTVVVYSSDHGDMIGEHGMFWKSNFYDGSSRVPLVFSRPGRFPAGTRLRGVCSHLDLAPTLLRMTGCPDLPQYDGLDLGDNIAGGRELPDERVVVSECSDIKGDVPSAMARYRQFKLVRFATYPQPQLFDLERDPAEEINLADDPAHAATREKLERELARHWDPEQALAEQAKAKKHFQLMKQWVAIAKPEPPEKWRCDADLSRIEGFQEK